MICGNLWKTSVSTAPDKVGMAAGREQLAEATPVAQLERCGRAAPVPGTTRILSELLGPRTRKTKSRTLASAITATKGKKRSSVEMQAEAALPATMIFLRNEPRSPETSSKGGAAMRRPKRRAAKVLVRKRREVIRDVMLSAGQCATWLTLDELAKLTHYPPASISAQLRHLRKPKYGGFAVEKRRRTVNKAMRADGVGALWEYAVHPVVRVRVLPRRKARRARRTTIANLAAQHA